jgi:glycine hydroxymethyltransferase
METVGSVFTNKYSEGSHAARCYAKDFDELEKLTISRALKAFDLDEEEWGVNVQPYSGTVANFAVFTAVLNPQDRVMGLDVPCGGHSSHGYYQGHKNIGGSSVYFESLPYKISPESGLVDYIELEKLAKLFQPKLIVCGGSAYPRDWDYPTIRRICNEVGALMLVDMAHFSALVAAKVTQSSLTFL